MRDAASSDQTTAPRPRARALRMISASQNEILFRC